MDSSLSHNRFLTPPVDRASNATSQATATSAQQRYTYTAQLGLVLSEPPATLEAWARNQSQCALESTPDKATAKVNKDLRIKPAVVSSLYSAGLVSGVDADGNAGFEHVVSLHSTLTTASMRLRRNSVATSVFRFIYGDMWLVHTLVEANQVANGSVVDMESFEGKIEQVISTHVCACVAKRDCQ